MNRAGRAANGRRGAQPLLRLFCLPYAGGSARVLRDRAGGLTLIVFSGGRPARRINDVHGKQQLLRELQEFLASCAYDRMAVQNDF